MVSAEQRSSLAPAPLQSLQRYCGLLRPYALFRYSRPRGGNRLQLLLHAVHRHNADAFV
jgi:hypothetical protein